MNDVTRILSAIEEGDQQASARLLELVYEELRRLAANKMANESPQHTLQATALVHEAYLRLVDGDTPQHWDNRCHFFAAAAEAMRRILVERSRRRAAIRNGGKFRRHDVETDQIAAPEECKNVLSLDEALSKLQLEDPACAELVKLRYFVGMSLAQAAEILNISTRKADLMWAFARSWLRREMETD